MLVLPLGVGTRSRRRASQPRPGASRTRRRRNNAARARTAARDFPRPGLRCSAAATGPDTQRQHQHLLRSPDEAQRNPGIEPHAAQFASLNAPYEGEDWGLGLPFNLKLEIAFVDMRRNSLHSFVLLQAQHESCLTAFHETQFMATDNAFLQDWCRFSGEVRKATSVGQLGIGALVGAQLLPKCGDGSGAIVSRAFFALSISAVVNGRSIGSH